MTPVSLCMKNSALKRSLISRRSALNLENGLMWDIGKLFSKTLHRTHANTNDISRLSLRGAKRRSNPKQKRDCHALRARNDCNDIYFVCISPAGELGDARQGAIIDELQNRNPSGEKFVIRAEIGA